MSYILDAIKRAEKQRRQDQVPTLESAVAGQFDTPSRLRTGHILGVVAVALIAAAIWFHQPIVSGLSLTMKQISGWSEGISSSGTTEESAVDSADQTEKNSNDDPNTVSENSVEILDNLATQTESSGLNQADSPIATSALQVSEAQRQALENINFSVVSYSKDAAKRFVMSGTKVLHEGDVISGFPILEINDGSVVLGVNGQKYMLQL